MFKFDFGEDFSKDENNQLHEEKLHWLPSNEINPLEKEETFSNDNFTEEELFPGITLKLIKSDIVINKLKKENCEYVIEAESQQSDLVPSKYEGGLKIWECTYDLGNYILKQKYELKDKLVLDLGCGVGITGLLALKNGAKVHFSDYNSEVLKYITIPNVKINNGTDMLKDCKFYSGDWESLTSVLNNQFQTETEKYDYIFTSETIYNSNNHEKLLKVYKNRLKQDGVGLVAGKIHYFGVGGGMRQFEDLVERTTKFNAKIVWSSDAGLKREILQITWKTL